MKYQAILSIHVCIMIAATGGSGPLQSNESCPVEDSSLNPLIREISF